MINTDFEVVYICECGSKSVTQVIKTKGSTVKTYWVCDLCGEMDVVHTIQNQTYDHGKDWVVTQRPVNKELQ
jgi:hypothetical protein